MSHFARRRFVSHIYKFVPADSQKFGRLQPQQGSGGSTSGEDQGKAGDLPIHNGVITQGITMQSGILIASRPPETGLLRIRPGRDGAVFFEVFGEA